ncbi:hypothetical protein J437_LFUL015630 [Ladona fulva]|uniref:SH2 domain-containing protein 4A n=1 Tax=Ladona fulva TaxID=123851 RepID=A0A8K0KK97_LADFU|nr:hypothetical protein J437_LFUL015630 [Ladona fulva]
MLQQILKDLWVDPELLAELDEDMKQTLFCHMRQEQIRRWDMWDKQQEEECSLRERKALQPKSQEKKQSRVQFLMGDDGEPWVWVMGEHADDKTIEEILEEEAIEKARKQAEKETEELRKNVAVELTEMIDFNQRQIEEYETVTEKDEEYPMDLYCTVDEIREPSMHPVSLDINGEKDMRAAFQEMTISKVI